jgi:phosphoglucomutase
MSVTVSPLAGKALPPPDLVNVPRLVTAYYTDSPDPAVPAQRVSFGTSGHRGSAFAAAFNEAHILAIAQAICLYRQRLGIDGPLFVGLDSHALSEPAFVSAIEVFAANGVTAMIDARGTYTPTPLISHAILTYNRGRQSGFADGIVITPSHNPPEDGGFKYNPPHGGPAGGEVTGWIEKIANEFLEQGLAGVRRLPWRQARASSTVLKHDYIDRYVGDLRHIVDVDAIRASGVKLGIDPLGGAGLPVWQEIVDRFGLDATIVNETIDPSFRFMTADWDGKIRMDCSSPYAMAPLLALRDRFDVAFANDTDADRHGIVCRSAGLLNPNHYLTVAIHYLFGHRPGWQKVGAIGKTIVSSSSIDRVAARVGRRLVETPVGFKWFVDGLTSGDFGFAGEESAGATFLRRDGTVWTTDKDGIVLDLLAAEMTAVTKRDPGELYEALTRDLGAPFYARIDAPATAAQRALLKGLSPRQIAVEELAGEPVRACLTAAPGNGEPFGGIKLVADDGWFAARPSGTEDVYKIYAESFRSADHLRRIQDEAQAAIDKVFAGP